MLKFRSSLVFACFVFCYVAFTLNAAYVTYEARRNEYLNIAPVQCVKTRSAIECCALCDLDDGCLTVNYNREDSECELLPPRSQPGDLFVTRLNWTFYMKPGCYDEDWVYFNQNCYLLVKEPMGWHHADGHCKTLGAELVDIHSAEELTFVANYHTNNSVSQIWYGLNDDAEEGSFRWSSGRPTTFTAFNHGEPNGGTSENCIATYGSKTTWYDAGCTAWRAFICEKSSV